MPRKVADKTFKKLTAVSLCVMLALSGGLILWNGNSNGIGKTGPVRIFVDSSDDVQFLRDQGLDIVEPYSGFVIANVDARQVRQLEYRGFMVIPEIALHTVAMDGFTIDTREGEPALDSNLRIDSYEMGSDGRYIVQFIGPVKEEWKIAVTNLGGEVGDYLPYNSFIVKMNTRTIETLSELRFVQWVGIFQPAYKIRPKLWDMDNPVDVEIITHTGKNVNSVLARLTESQVMSGYAGDDFGVVKATIDKSELPTLANIVGVSYIEPYYVPYGTNEYMQWAIQTNITNDRKMWDLGLNGTGQLIAIADTGLDYDHPAFREDMMTIVNGDIYNVTDMSRRKVVRYLTMAQYVGLDPWADEFAYKDSSRAPFTNTIGHGTMMAGIAVANDDYMDQSSNDGGAKGAKIIVQDVANVCDRGTGLDDCFTFIPEDYDLFFGPAYNEGARIHSNSWGTDEPDYDLESRMVDKYVFEHPDMFITWSAGNGGPISSEPHTAGSPSNAKDAFALGWVGSPSPLIPPDQNSVDGQGSTGPTPDGRLKPDMVMIGEGMSTISDGDPWSNAYVPDDLIFGTSYGSPATASMAAMIRQYYAEGYYPTGTPHPASASVPSAALVKALLMASGERCTQGWKDTWNEQIWPNNSQGWGRPLLDNVLYLPGDTKRTISIDHTEGVVTGDVITYNFTVNSNSVPLRVLLAWSDYPGTVGASTVLVNNLDLEVTDPNDLTYKGNFFSTPFATSESRPGGLFDAKNPSEGVHRWYPDPGVYSVKITAANIPQGPQPFALVINADIDTGYGQVEIDKAVYSENDVINIRVTDTDLTADGVHDRVWITSTTEDVPEFVNLAELEAGAGIWTASINTAFGTPYENKTLEVANGDIITVWYDDASPVHTAYAYGRVDSAGPIITNVMVTDITNAAATVTWLTDEPSDSIVFWGDTPALGTVSPDTVLVTNHRLYLTGLTTGTKYYLDVQSSDWMGHTTTDTNGGTHYTFSTTDKAEILLVIGDSTFTDDRVEYYRDAFRYGGWSFNEWYFERSGDPPLATLQEYKAVCWQTGLEQYPPFEDTQLTLIRDYLDGGGRFFASTHDVAWAFSPTSSSQFDTPERYEFLKASLKADWLADPFDWPENEGIVGDPISGAYTPPNRVSYSPHRDGAAGDEVVALASGGTTDYVWKSYLGLSNNDNIAIRWVSSAINDSAPGDDPNITWDNYTSKVVVFFFEFTGMEFGFANSIPRGDIMNKTIVWLTGSYHPVAEVSTPDGGEVYSGATVDIFWNVTTGAGVASQALLYSGDSGQTWTPISMAVPPGDRTFAWDISGLPNGDEYMVKVIVQDSATPPLNGTDASDGTFSIFKPGGDSVGPVTTPGSVIAIPNPVIETQVITFNGIIDDGKKGDSAIDRAEFFVQPTMPLPGDDGMGTPMMPADGSFDSVTENVTWPSGGAVNLELWGSLGTHTVWVHGQDVAGNWGTYYNASFEIIAVPPDRKVKAPTGLIAELSASPFGDVILTWTLSADDAAVGGGEDDVVTYDIYRGNTYDSTGSAYAFYTGVAAGTATYTDVGAGDGDFNDYFYYVVAVDDDANSARTANQVAKVTRQLTAGPQLVSNLLWESDMSLTSVLQTVNFDRVWTYAPMASNPWQVYDTTKAYSTVPIADNAAGAWVNVLGVDTMTIAGVVPTPSIGIQLYAGWNLVGYPSFATTYTLADFMTDTGATRVETYDAGAGPYFLREMTNPAEAFIPGSAYWAYVPLDVMWTVAQA
jgi:hypothetical protein